MSASGKGNGQVSGRTAPGGLSRRNLFAVMGGAAAAGAGTAFVVAPKLSEAQDNPINCAPPAPSQGPVPFKANTALPLRVRKSAFELSKTEVDRLKAAYAALRQLTQTDPTDPRGWLQQGHVHCWYCGGGSDGQSGGDIHSSWWFFPWHRAYLYFHERILCKLIGDDTFALPYWDWDTQGRQTFPSVYGDPNDSSNPLYDMLRSAMPGSKISPLVVSKPIMNGTMNAPINDLFMGTQSGDMGAMESQPHGPVHIWTADMTLENANNDMGVLATAAQDPVFYSHHGNIDRLWTVWLGLSAAHQNFNSPAWTQHSWQFYDENKVWTDIAISDVLDPQNSLRYTWQQPSSPPIWTFTPVVASGAGATTMALRTTTPEPPVLFSRTSAPTPIGTKPITKSVALPKPRVEAFALLKADAPRRYVLHIDGIHVPSDRQAMLNVYLNLPDANATTGVEVPNFVGTVTVLAMVNAGAPHPHKQPANAIFDVTGVLGRVVKAGNENLSITLVPVTAKGAPEKDAGATFQRAYIQGL